MRKIYYLFIGLIIIGGLGFISIYLSKSNKSTTQVQQENQSQPSADTNNDITDIDQENIYKNQYSIFFIDMPKYVGIRSRNAHEFELSFKAKNNDDKMITNIGLNYCTVEYRGIKKNSSVDGSEFQLKKALIKNSETAEPLRFNLNIATNFLTEDKVTCQKDGLDSNLAYMCSYSDSGECTCDQVNYKDLKILGCEFAITNNGKQAGNGWGNYAHYFSIE